MAYYSVDCTGCKKIPGCFWEIHEVRRSAAVVAIRLDHDQAQRYRKQLQWNFPIVQLAPLGYASDHIEIKQLLALQELPMKNNRPDSSFKEASRGLSTILLIAVAVAVVGAVFYFGLGN